MATATLTATARQQANADFFRMMHDRYAAEDARLLGDSPEHNGWGRVVYAEADPVRFHGRLVVREQDRKPNFLGGYNTRYVVAWEYVSYSVAHVSNGPSSPVCTFYAKQEGFNDRHAAWDYLKSLRTRKHFG